MDSSFIFTSLDIDNEFINNFEIVKLIPEPKSVQYGEDCNTFYYDKIIQNKSSEIISLILKAKSAGIFRGQIRVCEGGQYIEDSLIAVIE